MQEPIDSTPICLFRSEADLHVHRQYDYYKRWMEMSRDWRDTSNYSRRLLRYVHPATS